MEKYVILTDSGCDLPVELLDIWGVDCVDLSFHFDESATQYSNREMSSHEFYERMRHGGVPLTSGANPEAFRSSFIKHLEAGEDILYVGFSTGLSSTYASGVMVARELREEYPDRRIITVDSLAGSAGFGLLVYLARQKLEQGLDLEANAAALSSLVPYISQWLAIEDLSGLKRGGRVSNASAMAATILNLRPLINVDDEGRLVYSGKVRGKKASIKALCDRYAELCNGMEDGIFLITHGDCEEDAKVLDDEMFRLTGKHAAVISNIGPVVGSHTGPGTFMLSFLGKARF